MPMAVWKHKLHVEGLLHNDELSTQERWIEIVRRIRAAGFFDTEDYELVELVDELADAAEADQLSWISQVWDAFYDWADDHRVWVATF